MSSTYLTGVNCNHSLAGHFSHHFFCSNQSPFHNLAKIIAVAFMALASYRLGLAIPHLRAKFFPTTPSTSQKIPLRDYPAVGKTALQFANDQLEVYTPSTSKTPKQIDFLGWL